MAIKSQQFITKNAVEIECEDGTKFQVIKKKFSKEKILRMQKNLGEIQEEAKKVMSDSKNEWETAIAMTENSEKWLDSLVQTLNSVLEDGADGANLRKFLNEFSLDFAAITRFIEELTKALKGDVK